MARLAVALAPLWLGCAPLVVPPASAFGPAREAEARPRVAMRDVTDSCLYAGGADCHRGAWQILRREASVEDRDRWAAGLLLAGCESGHAPSCADLAAAYAIGLGVRRDPARACELGNADACSALGRPAPATAAAPTASLPRPEPYVRRPNMFDDDLPEIAALAGVVLSEEVAAELGVTLEDLERVPPAAGAEDSWAGGWAWDRDWRQVLLHRRAGACLARYRAADGTGSRDATWVSFVVNENGTTADVRVSEVDGDPAAAACARSALVGRDLPRPQAAGRVWMRLLGLGPLRGPPRAPAYATPPATDPPGCVEQRVLADESHELRMPLSFLVDVDSAGQPSRVRWRRAPEMPAHFVRVWGKVARDAARACRWNPAKDAAGRPVPARALIVIRPGA